jgi:hypothetical protein
VLKITKGDSYIVHTTFVYDGTKFSPNAIFDVAYSWVSTVGCIFKEEILGGHSLGGNCKSGHGWNIQHDIIEKYCSLHNVFPDWEV